MNKKQLSNILEVIADPIHGQEFYDRNSLTDLLNKVDSMTSEMKISNDTPQVEIIKIIQDYVKNNVQYRKEYLSQFYGLSNTFDEKELIYRTAYAALIKKEAICVGYAEAMRVLSAYYGIKSKTIIAELPHKNRNSKCHYLSAAFLDDGSVKIMDPERQIYCEKKGYDYYEYMDKLEYAVPNEIFIKNKLSNNGIGLFASEYLSRDDVKKARGINGIATLLQRERDDNEITIR